MKKIKRISPGCAWNICGMRFYETWYVWENEQGEERRNTHKVSFNVLKRMGVLKTFNSPKKLEKWLNGEGKQWYIDDINSKYDVPLVG